MVDAPYDDDALREGVTAAFTDPAVTLVTGPPCHGCGAANPAGFRFCGRCAAPLGVEHEGGWRDPLVGALVADRYRVIARIGVGGMGAVYKVEHVSIGRVFAMKLLHGELTRDADMVRRFNREARSVSRLSSRHTVSVVDYGRSDGLVYLVMEYLQGRDLAAILVESGPLQPTRVAAILLQVANSLTEAHGAGIIHRDIKPHNLFVCDGGAEPLVKVVDFGLARLIETRDESAALTRVDMVMGTPHYMSPEQIEGENLDGRTDIYSLAAVAYHLLTGEPPFHSGSALSIMRKHLSDPAPLLGERDPTWQRLDPVIQRALSKSPADRYSTVGGFAAAFSDAVGAMSSPGAGGLGGLIARDVGHESAAGTREEFERYERGLRRRRALSVGMASATVAAVVAGAVAWSVGGRSAPTVEREPNDGQSTALDLGSVGRIEGMIGESASDGGDRDVYLVRRPDAEHPVLVAAVSGIPGIDLVLEVVDGRGELIAHADDGGEGDGESLPNVMPGDGAAWVVVRPLYEQGVPAPSNALSASVLTTRYRSGYFGEEREPNDTIERATPLVEGQASAGLIGGAGDRDVYTLNRTEGTATEIVVTGVPGIDLDLQVLGADGAEIASIDEAGVGQGESARLGGLGVYGAARYVAVRRVSGAASHMAYFVESRAVTARAR